MVTIYESIQCHLPEHRVFREVLSPTSAQKCASIFRLNSPQFSILKMVAMCSFETLVPVYQTRYQNLQDHNLNLHLKSYERLQRKGMEGTKCRKQREISWWCKKLMLFSSSCNWCKKVELVWCSYGKKLSMLIKTCLIVNTKTAAKIKLKKVTFVINNDITKKNLYKWTYIKQHENLKIWGKNYQTNISTIYQWHTSFNIS